MKYIKALIKFSKEEQFRQDLINGLLYFRSIKKVREVNDPFDSFINTVPINSGMIKGSIKWCDTFTLSQPVCCFYTLEDDLQNKVVKPGFDPRIKERLKKDLGAYVTIIKDVPSFIERVKVAHPKLWYGKCEYNTKTEHAIPEFEKGSKYSAEKEFRFVIYDWIIHNESNDFLLDYYKNYLVLEKQLFLKIGSIDTIVETCTIDELFEKESIETVFDNNRNSENILSNLSEYRKFYSLQNP